MAFLRVLFILLSLFFMTAFMVTLPVGSLTQKIFIGLGSGLLLSALLLSLESLFKRYHLKAFNTAILGLFVGYLMGRALVSLFYGMLDLTHMGIVLQPQTVDILKVSLYLIGTYLGTVLTLHFSEQFHVSIPFVKVNYVESPKKDLIVDATALSDTRILDLASTGLIDNLLVIPKALTKQIQNQAELGNENEKASARRALDTVKKLEAVPKIGLRYEEATLPEEGESFHKLICLARQLDANILTADMSQVQIPPVEGIKIINLHALSNALKPLNQAGEVMKIKIQRFGKEPNQGVGYLDDGTMVVVNGGGDFVGENIDVQVLSVKHTSSGRMIFCNTMDDGVPAKGNRVEV